MKMKKYRLEGEPQEAEMVECDVGEYVKVEDAEKIERQLKMALDHIKALDHINALLMPEDGYAHKEARKFLEQFDQ